MREIFTEEVVFKLRLKDKHLFSAWGCEGIPYSINKDNKSLKVKSALEFGGILV